MPKLNSISEIEALYPIVTATNGAWPKPETVKDFSVRLGSLFGWARNPSNLFSFHTFVQTSLLTFPS
jgi:hypothetical protein